MCRLLEVLLEAFVAPTRASQLLPRIVISICAPIPLHAINDGASTYNISCMHLPGFVLHERLRGRSNIVIILCVDEGEVRDAGSWSVINGAIFNDKNGYYQKFISTLYSSDLTAKHVPSSSSVKRLATTKPLSPPPTIT